MKSPSVKLVRPTSIRPREDADPVGSARIYVEVDAGAGPQVTLDIKIAVRSRNASGLPRVVRELEPPSAELSDELSPDQQPDEPEGGPYVVTLFGQRVPVSQLKTRRRRFGRRR